MRRLISFSLAALILYGFTVLLSNCAKEYSYEGGAGNASSSGTAEFSFTGTGGSCLGSTVNGKYYAGTALDASNTVQLQVDVTKAGTYTVTTSAVNGFRFSASGTFTQTGLQSLTLTASGTPNTEGSAVFKTPVGVGCSFTISTEKAPPVLAGYSFTGTSGTCTGANVQGNYIAGSDLNATNMVVLAVDVAKAGQYDITTDTVDNIYFNASGNFTTTGMQTVPLFGRGKPDIADSVTLTPSAPGIKGCSFSLAVVNGDPMAVYVLESGLNTCVGLPSGTYTAGQPMTAANTIAINVYVSTIGKYTVASTIVNGIRFYASGAFTTTGTQKLVLQAMGQPIAIGDFLYVPRIIGPHPLGGQSCGFTVAVK